MACFSIYFYRVKDSEWRARELCTSASFHMERTNLKQWFSVFDHMLIDGWKENLISSPMSHYFDTPKSLQFYLHIQIRKWKTDWLWQFEKYYVCSDPSSNENRMIPNLGMVTKLKLLIWNCQDQSVQNQEVLLSPSFGEHQFQGFKIIVSPYYQKIFLYMGSYCLSR